MVDKNIERERFNKIASDSLLKNESHKIPNLKPPLKIPTLFYKSVVNEYSSVNSRILEIGAGMGENTCFLLDSGASVLATDISEISLIALSKRFSTSRLSTKVEDMEKLSFNNEEFDIVCCAGSLSYGDNITVMNEIYRVLKFGGVLIVIDSLNHNPIYKINRYIHYLKGNRSKSTLNRMPTIGLINKYINKFGNGEIKYFGSIVWSYPVLRKILPDHLVVKLSNFIDNKFKIKASAFKFVMVLHKK